MVGFHDSLPRELGFIASAFGPIHHLDVKREIPNRHLGKGGCAPLFLMRLNFLS